MGRALLVIDVQNDFCEGGSVPVPGGEEVARPLSEVAHAMASAGGPVFASRDWHPAKSHHFREWGGKWPPHCVQETWGAEFVPDLRLPDDTIVISKGMAPKAEGYSVFEGFDPSGVPFDRCLEDLGVRVLLVGGLATDHCVKETAMDARMRGLRVQLLVDAVRPVDTEAGEGALRELETTGVTLITSREALRDLADWKRAPSEAPTEEAAHP